jgi:hypothetical protein
MPEINVAVNVELFCGKCGAEISDNGTERRNRNGALDIDPCVDCLKAAEKRGYDEGYNARDDEA